MTDVIDPLHRYLNDKLSEIAESGVLQPEYKFTFIARHPTNENAHVVCGDDSLIEAANVLLHGRLPHVSGPDGPASVMPSVAHGVPASPEALSAPQGEQKPVEFWQNAYSEACADASRQFGQALDWKRKAEAAKKQIALAIYELETFTRLGHETGAHTAHTTLIQALDALRPRVGPGVEVVEARVAMLEALADCVKTFEWLDVQGRLGYEKHDAIRASLVKARAALASVPPCAETR